ncbi:MAG: DUF4350 domain-containing protein [Deltaproteobacteria bacterium]|nr:DUF4350 domain-containing protein [Deltaproteobacteria bacterium]
MFKATLRMTAISALSFLVFSAAPSSALAAKGRDTDNPGAKKAAHGKTVFDLAHAEIFSPVQTGPLHYSAFYEGFKRAGEDVMVSAVNITPESLEGVKTVVFAGPSRDVWPSEVDSLVKFVHDGGNLLVLLHISKPVARLTEPFGIIVSNFVVSEPENNIGGQSQDFYVSKLAPHPVTEGVKKIAVFGTWGLMTENKAQTVAATSDKAWADLNRNRVLDKGEPVQSFGIVAVNQFGKGKVVVVTDDAPFANKFINEGDNKKFTDNIIRWFK